MKNQLTSFAILLAFAASSASALPLLQLDVPGGNWVASNDVQGEDTIITTADTFSIYAYLTDGEFLEDNFTFSAAVVPVLDFGTDFGSFDVDGTDYSSANASYGSLPVSGHDPLKDDTYYFTQTFNFNESDKVKAYNVEDSSGTTPEAAGANDPFMYFVKFDIDVTSLYANMELHFDLYSEELKANGNPVDFAPFSHDAGTDGGKDPRGDEFPVPEPSSILLLAIGLAGLSLVRKQAK